MLTFVTAKSQKIGLGHYKRCINLSNEAELMNYKTEIYIFSDRIEKNTENKIFFPIEYLFKFPNDKFIKLKSTFLFIDLSFPLFLKSKIIIQKWFKYFNYHSKKTIIIDSLGVNSIFKKAPYVETDFLILPYISEEKINMLCNPKILQGGQYVILPKEYKYKRNKKFNRHKNKILLTFGGSDINNLSLKILKILEKFETNLEIKIIIGPFYNSKIIVNILLFFKESKHNIIIIDKPNSIYKYILWSDVVISNSGLTKYEIAATGTPAIHISIDNYHKNINHSFLKHGSAIEVNNPVENNLNKILKKILYNKDFYDQMSENGKKNISNLGTKKIIKEVLKIND